MKNKKRGKKKDASNPEIDDPRFAQMVSDPRFRTMRNEEKKVKIDERFQGMFSEKRFTAGNRVDKRGNLILKPQDEHLEDHYELDIESKKKKEENAIVRENIPDARGLDSDVESTSSDEESEEEEEESIDHDWGELDKDAPRTDEATRRLAVCNIDWDRIRAVDLFVLFNSFKPDTGLIKSVNIYPSEFGKKRMEEEKLRGPTEIVETPILEEDDGIKHEEGDGEQEYMTEKLRQYQLNRLKYYYAIVDCDSAKTASALYKELDGFEYENSSSALDVRFVPEDMTFDEETSSQCTTHPDFSTYKAPNFVTTALQQSKVQMTWDENDPSRQQKIDEAFSSKSEQALNDLDAFLASSENEDSDEEDEEYLDMKKEPVKNKVCKYKQLLKSLEEEDEGEEGEMDIKFPEEEGNSDEEMGESDQVQVSTDKNVEKFVKKRKTKTEDAALEKKEDEDEGLELLLMDDDESNKKHFDYSKLVKETGKKKKRKKGKKSALEDEQVEKDNFDFDPDDPRFSKLFSSHLYNIDPSDPHFKNTNAMQILMDKKHQPSSSKEEQKPAGAALNDNEVYSLVASIKRKAKRMKCTKSD